MGTATLAGALLSVVAMTTYGVDPWGAIGLPLLLAAITVPLLVRSRLARLDGLGGVLVAGLIIKFIGATMKYISDVDWYDGVADTVGYHRNGEVIAEQFRSGRIGVTDLLPTTPGTRFIEELSGLTQSVVGSSVLANYMVFAWLAFLGLVAMLAAARIAVPNLLARRYAILLLFLPSVAFWGSGISKDAWMLLALGLFALGAAQIFDRRAIGLLPLAAGITAMAYVRPHLVLLALGSFAVALLVGRRASGGTGKSSSLVLRVVGLVAVVAGFAFGVSQATGLLPGFSPDGGVDLSITLDVTAQRSSYGGSEIDITSPNNPLEYPYAFATVMFRPFLFEASSFNTLLAAAESFLLIVLFVVWRRDVVAGLRRALREQYLMMAGLYALGFAFAWSSVGNLGIIARQRTQVIFFLILFLCVPAIVSVARRQSPPPAVEGPPSSVAHPTS